MTPTLIAAVYPRKSTEQAGIADEQKSVARHVEHARAYAASKGWTVLDPFVFVDDGVSGAEFANRPGGPSITDEKAILALQATADELERANASQLEPVSLCGSGRSTACARRREQLPGRSPKPYSSGMEVHVTPETAKKLKDLAAISGRAPEDIVEDALAGYLEDVASVRKTLDSRYDDLKSGRVKPVDGEEAFRTLREKSEHRRSGG
jgi:predicted transcriptional regulator